MTTINPADQKARGKNDQQQHLSADQRRDVKATRVNIKLVLAFTEGLFRHRKTLNDGTWEKTLDSGKKVLRKSQKEPETRCASLESSKSILDA